MLEWELQGLKQNINAIENAMELPRNVLDMADTALNAANKIEE